MASGSSAAGNVDLNTISTVVAGVLHTLQPSRFTRDTPDLDAQSRFPDSPHLFPISPADDKTVNLNRLQLASS